MVRDGQLGIKRSISLADQSQGQVAVVAMFKVQRDSDGLSLAVHSGPSNHWDFRGHLTLITPLWCPVRLFNKRTLHTGVQRLGTTSSTQGGPPSLTLASHSGVNQEPAQSKYACMELIQIPGDAMDEVLNGLTRQ
ncbi:hypothetical protein Baya_8845 [Bagarius yarrelli]|uniref:Uncharacterized protein n=1 Tax=Bagarius yarrelli TaxID=175774 RepID=A0A556UAK5_BAGYA|nr:hypothetical protein Baya_8845 [Bagarius yarrelli]